MIYIWYTYDIHLIYIWYTYDIHMIYIWYTYDIHMIYIWYTYDIHMIYIWYTYDIHMIYIWYTYITYVNVYVRILHRYIDIYICHPSLANWRSSALQLNFEGRSRLKLWHPQHPKHSKKIPSGKRLHNYGKSPCYLWVNPLFRLGHFQ